MSNFGLFKNLWATKRSIKQHLFLYIAIDVLLFILLTTMTNIWCKSWEELLLNSVSTTTPINLSMLDYKALENLGLNPKTLFQLRGLLLFRMTSVFIYALLCTAFIVQRFYRDHIQEPLFLLTTAANHIRDNDLSFSCTYNSQDEFSDICTSVDTMRLALQERDDELSTLYAKQKILNAAFAHDLRTPLTVMEGYIELITTFYPEGRIDEENLLRQLALLQRQVYRLKDYSETMNQLHSLDERQLTPVQTNQTQMYQELTHLIEGLQSRYSTLTIGLKAMESPTLDTPLYCDLHCFLEIAENLLSNAIGFAHHRIDVQLDFDEKNVILYIRDDGPGFDNTTLIKGEHPYYSSRKNQDGHYGIGLTVTKVLCQKHGGSLTLQNSIHGGAIVCGRLDVHTCR